MGPEYKKTFSTQCCEIATMERELQVIGNRKACKSAKVSPAFLKSAKRTAAKIVMRMRSGSSNLNRHLARKKIIKQEKRNENKQKKKNNMRKKNGTRDACSTADLDCWYYG